MSPWHNFIDTDGAMHVFPETLQSDQNHKGEMAVKFRNGPDGLHLFDRRSGLNVLLNEVQISQDQWATAPRQVSIALTNLCDLQCSYCYAPKHRSVLNSDTVARWLKELDEAQCMGIGFGGGEPTLHPDFPEICRTAAETTRLAVTFTTHGHRLVPPLLEQLAGNVHFIRISVDGIGSTYESLRARSFTKLLDRMRDARQIAPIGINVVVNRHTVNELGALAEIAINVGASELLLLPQQATHTAPTADDSVRKSLDDWVRASDSGLRLAVSESGAQGLPTCDPLPGEKGLRSYAHIDATGIARTSSYSENGVEVGADGVIAAISRLRAATGDAN